MRTPACLHRPRCQVNINRSNARAGFTLPKFMWRDALGREQFALLAECLQVRGTRCHAAVLRACKRCGTPCWLLPVCYRSCCSPVAPSAAHLAATARP